MRTAAILLIALFLCFGLAEPALAQQADPGSRNAPGQASPFVQVLGLLVLAAPAAFIAWRSWGKRGAPNIKQRA